MHCACCWEQDSPWSALGIQVRGRSWCQHHFALLTVPMPHTCRTELPQDGKAKAPAQQNEAATSDGVPVLQKVSFGRQLNSKDILHYSKPKYFSPLQMLDKPYP